MLEVKESCWGYLLAKAPSAITLGEIIRLMEGGLLLLLVLVLLNIQNVQMKQSVYLERYGWN